jgi:hypothetical protein
MPTLFNDRRRIDLLLLDLGFVNHSFVLFFAGFFHAFARLTAAHHRSRNCALDCDAYASLSFFWSKRQACAAKRFVQF